MEARTDGTAMDAAPHGHLHLAHRKERTRTRTTNKAGHVPRQKRQQQPLRHLECRNLSKMAQTPHPLPRTKMARRYYCRRQTAQEPPVLLHLPNVDTWQGLADAALWAMSATNVYPSWPKTTHSSCAVQIQVLRQAWLE